MPFPRRAAAVLSVAVLVSAAAVFTVAAGPAQAASPLRVMAVGDSITQGFENPALNIPGVGVVGSWRYWFWQSRGSLGCGTVDMVGEFRTYNNYGPGGQLPGATTDQDHESEAGAQIDLIRSRVKYQRAVTNQQPDVVLMLLGTNDLFYWNTPNDPPASVRDQMSALIDEMRAQKPDITFLLMGINPRGTDRPDLITTTNTYYQQIAATRDTPVSPIEYVDGWTGFDEAADTLDHIHPNLSGQHKISDRFTAALASRCAGQQPPTTTTSTTVPTTTTTACVTQQP